MEIFLKDIKERFPEFEISNYDDSVYFSGFNHDSRHINEGDLFLPIKGESFDGHDFILDALKNGASVSLCESKNSVKVIDAKKPVIFVDSIEEGLQKILNFVMSFIPAVTIGITGSTGKTTTRQMLSAILSMDGKVLTSDHSNTVWGNANLIGQYKDEKYIVLECGMDRKGEIAWHVNSEDPDIGILLNVGSVHAEKLGSIENIYEEKKNLADYLNRMGRPLILNIDDVRLARIQKEYRAKLVTFGEQDIADFNIGDIEINELGTKFILRANQKEYVACINAYGEGLVYDAVAAIACANTLGLDIGKCLEGVKEFYPNNARFEKTDLGNGNIIINDAYNANPDSMKMAIITFDKLYPKSEYFRVAILGDMKELGSVTEFEHKKLGEIVKDLDFNKVYYLGDYFDDFNCGERLYSVEDAVGVVRNMVKARKNVAILLKASHSIGLSEVPDLV